MIAYCVKGTLLDDDSLCHYGAYRIVGQTDTQINQNSNSYLTAIMKSSRGKGQSAMRQNFKWGFNVILWRSLPDSDI